MKLHAIRIRSACQLRLLLVASLLFVFSLSLVRGASDTDVTIIKAEKVVIEEDLITIIAQARTIVRLIKEISSEKSNDSTWMGRPVAVVEVLSDRATFTIKRPELNFNDPNGTHAKEKEKSRKILDEGWKMSLAAAKELQEGREIGRLGYYAPDIVIKNNLVHSIVGFGYLYPKRD